MSRALQQPKLPGTPDQNATIDDTTRRQFNAIVMLLHTRNAASFWSGIRNGPKRSATAPRGRPRSLDDELFEDLDDVDDDLHAHARACGEEEKKEAVQLDDSTLVGLLPKKLNEKQLDAPTIVVELSMNKIKSGIDDGILSDFWSKASVMRRRACRLPSAGRGR